MKGEIGATGLKMVNGYSYEEFHKSLQGQKGIKVYKEMKDNDAVIGAILFITNMVLRGVKWKVVPFNMDSDSKMYADFIEECIHDMDMSWEDFISDALSMLPFGWSAHEICYKTRSGSDSTTNYSKYNDGLIAWKGFPIRSQDSLNKWMQDGYGKVYGMEQQLPSGEITKIPFEKLLILRTETYKDNPEGRSILRNAYESWYYAKNLRRIEAIGMERDANGIPVMYVPPEYFVDDASPEQKATLNQLKNIVTNIRRDEQAGLLLPMMYDDVTGNQLFKLELLSTAGQKQYDINQAIVRYESRMAMTILADFILLGHSSIGSFALSEDKTNNFSKALGAWLQQIANVVNTQAIPKLMKLNGMDVAKAPKLVPDPVKDLEATKFANAVQALISTGALTPDFAVEQKARELIKVDPIREEDRNPVMPKQNDKRIVGQGEGNPANGLDQGQTVADIGGAR